MAVSKERIEELLYSSFPNAKLQVHDFAGDENHYEVTVECPSFVNLSLLEQHKLVYAALDPILKSNELHAVKINTKALPHEKAA